MTKEEDIAFYDVSDDDESDIRQSLTNKYPVCFQLLYVQEVLNHFI